MIAPARIRFDDTVIVSDQFPGKELQKFKKHIEWCKNIDVALTPAILCEATDEIPGGAELLRQMICDGKIYPDLHGWTHGPYQEMELRAVCEHLEKSQEWFRRNLDVPALRWVTPHGSDSAVMREAAAMYDLVIETTAPPVEDQKPLDSKIRVYKSLAPLQDVVIMVHWWERGLRLYRMARLIEHQSIEGAIEATRSELSKKDHKICWNEWETK